MIALGATVALAAGAGLAYGSSQGGGKAIYACASNGTGTLRVIHPGARGAAGHCGRAEHEVTWN
jgi:hypothetical protein